jgi:hypothetical protein
MNHRKRELLYYAPCLSIKTTQPAEMAEFILKKMTGLENGVLDDLKRKFSFDNITWNLQGSSHSVDISFHLIQSEEIEESKNNFEIVEQERRIKKYL